VRMKLRGGTSKWILRRSAESLLPAEVLTRGKQGFAVPIGRWFRDGMLPSQPHAGIINPAFWAAHLATHRSGRSDQRLYLWSDLMLSRLRQTAAAPSPCPVMDSAA